MLLLVLSLGLFFYPENGGGMFLRIVGLLSRDYAVLYARGYKSLHKEKFPA
jgi:hypothetical protein